MTNKPRFFLVTDEEGWLQLGSSTRLVPGRSSTRYKVGEKTSVLLEFKAIGKEGEVSVHVPVEVQVNVGIQAEVGKDDGGRWVLLGQVYDKGRCTTLLAHKGPEQDALQLFVTNQKMALYNVSFLPFFCMVALKQSILV